MVAVTVCIVFLPQTYVRVYAFLDALPRFTYRARTFCVDAAPARSTRDFAACTRLPRLTLPSCRGLQFAGCAFGFLPRAVLVLRDSSDFAWFAFVPARLPLRVCVAGYTTALDSPAGSLPAYGYLPHARTFATTPLHLRLWITAFCVYALHALVAVRGCCGSLPRTPAGRLPLHGSFAVYSAPAHAAHHLPLHRTFTRCATVRFRSAVATVTGWRIVRGHLHTAFTALYVAGCPFAVLLYLPFARVAFYRHVYHTAPAGLPATFTLPLFVLPLRFTLFVMPIVTLNFTIYTRSIESGRSLRTSLRAALHTCVGCVPPRFIVVAPYALPAAFEHALPLPHRTFFTACRQLLIRCRCVLVYVRTVCHCAWLHACCVSAVTHRSLPFTTLRAFGCAWICRCRLTRIHARIARTCTAVSHTDSAFCRTLRLLRDYRPAIAHAHLDRLPPRLRCPVPAVTTRYHARSAAPAAARTYAFCRVCRYAFDLFVQSLTHYHIYAFAHCLRLLRAARICVPLLPHWIVTATLDRSRL